MDQLQAIRDAQKKKYAESDMAITNTKYDDLLAILTILTYIDDIKSIYHLSGCMSQMSELIDANITIITNLDKKEELINFFGNFITSLDSTNIRFNMNEDVTASSELDRIKLLSTKIIDTLGGNPDAIKFEFLDSSSDEAYALSLLENEEQLNNDAALARRLANND